MMDSAAPVWVAIAICVIGSSDGVAGGPVAPRAGISGVGAGVWWSAPVGVPGGVVVLAGEGVSAGDALFVGIGTAM